MYNLKSDGCKPGEVPYLSVSSIALTIDMVISSVGRTRILLLIEDRYGWLRSRDGDADAPTVAPNITILVSI